MAKKKEKADGLEARFTIKKDERLFVNDKWICNGHWAIARTTAQAVASMNLHGQRAAWDKVLNLKHGDYQLGYASNPTRDETPDLKQVIPSKSTIDMKYDEMNPAPIRAEVTADFIVNRFVFERVGKKEIEIAPRYAPLLKLATTVKARESGYPVVLFDNDRSIIGVVMPLNGVKK